MNKPTPLDKHMKACRTEVHKGWTLEVEPCMPFAYEFYVPSMCFGRILASHSSAEGMRYLMQPLWITFDQMKKLKTELDMESAFAYMLDNGRRLVKQSIDKCRKGKIKVDVFPAIDTSPFRKTRIAV